MMPKRISRFASVSTIVLLAMSLSACNTGVNPPKVPRGDPYESSQIHAASTQLRRDTAIGTPIVARDEAGDLVHVTIPIRSAIDKDLRVDYDISFFDRDGRRLSKMFGGTKTLKANTPDSIEVNSMSPRAADFQLDLRYAR